jgi:hypothetical protein
MSEMEMKDEVETEEFTDELSDEALDREGGGKFLRGFSFVGCVCR